MSWNSEAVQSTSRSALTVSVRRAHRIAPPGRCRVVVIMLTIIFAVFTLLLQFQPGLMRSQSVLPSNGISLYDHSGNHNHNEVSNNVTADFVEASAFTAPSRLVTMPHSRQQYELLSSSPFQLTNEAGRTSKGPTLSIHIDSSTSKNTPAKVGTPPPSPTSAAVSEAIDSCPPGPLLTVNGGGRLGNKLCQYFTLWAEHHTNFTSASAWIASKMAHEFSRQFAGRRSITELPSHCRPKKLHPVRMDAIVSSLKIGKNVCIGGGVCNIAGFARYRDKMLAEFPWKDDIMKVAASRLALAGHRHRCHVSNCTFIGVHMRRTDYSGWIKSRMRGQALGTEYFQCALSLCRRRYSGAVFIVASDDVEWARTNILGSDVALAADLVPAGGLADRAAALDMATLSLCNHTIVSYGTYSYMAAFMAGGDVVAPTGYSKTEHFAADGMIRAGWPVTLLHYRTCREVPLDDRTPFAGLSLVISCDM